MKKNIRVFTAICGALLFCAVTLAQDPMVNIDPNTHPNLAQAQNLVAQASHHVALAQTDRYNNFEGHAAKARMLMVQANEELKIAADIALAHQRNGR